MLSPFAVAGISFVGQGGIQNLVSWAEFALKSLDKLCIDCVSAFTRTLDEEYSFYYSAPPFTINYSGVVKY